VRFAGGGGAAGCCCQQNGTRPTAIGAVLGALAANGP
jgi:hypothetical protein